MLVVVTNVSQRAAAQGPSLAVASVMGTAISPWTRVRNLHHGQPARCFRFGFWSSHRDSDHPHELRRCRRTIKYKYMEAIHRNLSWEKHPRSSDYKKAHRRMMLAYWRAGEPHIGGRYINQDQAKPAKDDSPGTRPGQNIEDVERGAMDNLLRTSEKPLYEYDMWQSPLQNIRNFLANQDSQIAETASSARAAGCRPTEQAQEQPSKEDSITYTASEFYIDPITNRKVATAFKEAPAETGSSIPIKTFQASGRQSVPDSKDNGNVSVQSDRKASRESSTDRLSLQTSVRDADESASKAQKTTTKSKAIPQPAKSTPGETVKNDDLGRPNNRKATQSVMFEGPATPNARVLDSMRSTKLEKPASRPTEGESLSAKASPVFDTEEEGWRTRLQSFFEFDEASERIPTAAELRAKNRLPPTNSAQRQSLESDMERVGSSWIAANAGAQETLHKAPKSDTDGLDVDAGSAERSMSGNYVRDFPEEFTESWNVENSLSKDVLQPSSQGTSWEDVDSEYQSYVKSRGLTTAIDQTEAKSFDEPFPSRLETSLDRQKSVAQSDQKDQKLQDQELAHEIRQIYEDAYGEIRAEPTVTMTSEPTAGPEVQPATQAAQTGPVDTTLYKILAYDPTMQSINVAETTSIVPDNSTALTPAEVLLRLSNPSKFFPHFGPLRAEGYEIVSGSGDVLVFRKVRDTAAAESTSTEASATTSSSSSSTASATTIGSYSSAESSSASMEPPAPAAAPPPRVNPIDMTGSYPTVVTGNYASPTGYVNYDYPDWPSSKAPRKKPPPPFRSGIDVRREEPVFSGPKEERPSRGRRLVRRAITGALWVAGVSYGIGVVAEYWKAGGL